MKISTVVKRMVKSEQAMIIIGILVMLVLTIVPIVPELYKSEGKKIIFLLGFFPVGVIFNNCISIVEQLKCKKISIVFLDLISIIVVYSMMYTNLYYLNPESFKLIKEGIIYLDMLYFSIVTFTTLGYGDIVPVSYSAMFLSASEAFIFTCVIAFSLITYSDCIKGFLAVFNETREE